MNPFAKLTSTNYRRASIGRGTKILFVLAMIALISPTFGQYQARAAALSSPDSHFAASVIAPNGVQRTTPLAVAATCTGNADAAPSLFGLSGSTNALGAPDSSFAQLYETGDQIVLDLTDELAAGSTYTIRWKSASNTSTVTVEESLNGTSFSAATGSPFSVVSSGFANTNIIAGATTRYLRLTTTNSKNLQLDSVSYASASCNVGVASAISGSAFRDYDANGIQDLGEPGIVGVVVNIFDNNGANQGTIPTDTDGNYSIAVTSPGTYRVEFTLPASLDFLKAGAAGGTTVQFVADGEIANVGFNNPADYSQDNPFLTTPWQVFGDQVTAADSYPTRNTLTSISSAWGGVNTTTSDPTTWQFGNPPVKVAEAQQTGTLYGIAWQRSTKTLFAGAYFKHFAGFGQNGSGDKAGAIYSVGMDPATGDNIAAPVLFADVNAFSGVDVSCPDRPRVTGGQNDEFDLPPKSSNATIADIGKCSLGDLEISDDETILFAMDLKNRQVLRINADNGNYIGAWQVPTAGLPIDGGGTCDPNDVRPFGLGYKDGELYVGAVCSAESTVSGTDNGDPTKMHAYVWKVNSSGAYSLILNYQIIADRDDALGTSNGWRNWNPWKTNYAQLDAQTHPAYSGVLLHPQPMLADIEFYGNDLILGFRDRLGDQWGHKIPAPSDVSAIANGDLKCVAWNGSVYDLENNGTCGGRTAIGAGDGDDPTGEFYWGDGAPDSGQGEDAVEYSTGAVAQWTTQPLVHAAVDPGVAFDVGYYDAQGVNWLDNQNGAARKGYVMYDGSGQGDWGKSSGLGDLEALSDPAPLEVGNRVWNDADGDGIQDPGETGIDDLTVELYKGGVKVAETTTADGGLYLFSYDGNPNSPSAENWSFTSDNEVLTDTAYEARVATAQTPLTDLNLNLTVTDAAQPANGNASAMTNDPIKDIADSDAEISGANAVIAYTTGSAGVNNHGLDFGFQLNSCILVDWHDTVHYNEDGYTDSFSYSDPGPIPVTIPNIDGSGIDMTVAPDPREPRDITTNEQNTFAWLEPYFDTDQTLRYWPADGQGPFTTHISFSEDVQVNRTSLFARYDSGTRRWGAILEAYDDVDANGVCTGNKLLPPATTPLSILEDYNTRTSETYPVPVANTLTIIDASGVGDMVADMGAFSDPIQTPGSHPDNLTTLDTTGVFALGTGNSGNLRSPVIIDYDFVSARCLSWHVFQYEDGVNLGDGQVNFGITSSYLGPMLLNCYSMSLGSTVFEDANDNGQQDGAEAGIADVDVELYTSTQTPGTDIPFATATTDANGDYFFGGLTDGDYVVYIPTPPASTPTSSSTTSTVDDDVDGDDNGSQPGGSGTPVTSPVITLSAGNEPLNGVGANDEADQGANTTGDNLDDVIGDDNGNMTVDFGFVSQQTIYDWGDLPDANGTTNLNGPEYNTDSTGVAGPSHVITTTLNIGANTDDEPDGQPSAAADGDDLNGSTPDDENGVTLPTFTAGQSATVAVTVTNNTGSTATLYGFIDFDGDGAFTTPGETVTTTVSSGTTNGAANLLFNAPAGADTAQALGARFRLSTDTGLGPDGPASDGEVEDYLLTVAQARAAIGDYVWYDANDDGVQDVTEVGIANVKLWLYEDDGNGSFDPLADTLVATTTTDSDGGYLFGNAIPETYFVDVDEGSPALAGLTATSGPQSNVDYAGPVTLANDDTYRDADFGFVLQPGGNAIVGDTVFFDGNNNGVQDVGEPGIPNVDVEARNSGGTVIGSGTTDANGVYRVTVPAGSGYTAAPVAGTLPSAAVTATTPVPHPLPALNAGDQYLDADFGYIGPDLGRIDGLVFDDDANNGVYNAGADVIIAGVSVQLFRDDNNNGVLDNADPVIATMVTNSSGDGNDNSYSFGSLPADTYFVQVSDTQNVLRRYEPGNVGTPDVDHNSQAQPYRVDLGGGATVLTADFGYVSAGGVGSGDPTGLIGNQVWYDLNGDGLFAQSTEPGIAGVTVDLWVDTNNNGTLEELIDVLTDTTTTGASGNYMFLDVPGDDYLVRVSDNANVLTGYQPTQDGPTQGADNNNQVQPYLVSLPIGGFNFAADFGYETVLVSSYSISKTLISPSPVRAGDVITFTIRISNTGATALTTIPLVDTYDPTYLVYVGASPASVDNVNDGTINWADLTSASPTGFGAPVPPGQRVDVTVEFIGMQDTTQLSGSETVNTGTGTGVLAGATPIADASDTAAVTILNPTAVLIADHSVRQQDGMVTLAWETWNESEINGFNLYRLGSDGERVKLNEQPIAAQFAGQELGAEYNFTDAEAPDGLFIGYELELLIADGETGILYLGYVRIGTQLIFLPVVSNR